MIPDRKALVDELPELVEQLDARTEDQGDDVLRDLCVAAWPEKIQQDN